VRQGVISLEGRLGVPQVTDVVWDLDGDYTVPIRVKVIQAGATTVKRYQDTSIEVREEDMVIHDIPRWYDVDHVRYGVCLVNAVLTVSGWQGDRAEVIWLDQRPLTHYEAIVRMIQQR